MKIRAGKLLFGAIAVLWANVVSATPAAADEGWVIDSFHSDIQIAADSSLTVTEDIRVDFGPLQKHGIFRTIPVKARYDSSHARHYGFNLESVTDGSKPVPHELSGDAYNDTIKIGDPNSTVRARSAMASPTGTTA